MAEGEDRELDNIIGPPGQSEDVVSARERFQRLSEEVQRGYAKVSEDVRRGAERASEEIRRGAERARATYEEQSNHGMHLQGGNLTREVSQYVQDNPVKVILISAGVGFLLGLLVRGGRPRE